MKARYRWVVEIEVDATWVADGFDLTDERAKEMIQNELPWAYGHEVDAKILKAPPAADIRKEQGWVDLVKGKGEAI